MDRKPEPGVVWNRLRPEEQTVILETALQQPDLSPREVDHECFRGDSCRSGHVAES
jgi:hypothetical protein